MISNKAKTILTQGGLIKYLSKQLGIPVELVIPQGYEELVEAIGKKEVDLAYFGGVTYVQAHEKYGVVPIAMRDIDKDFSTYFIARNDSIGNALKDFKNTRLSFGNRLSTSGHFMPLYFLKKQGIKPSHFFSEVQYSGSHDASIFNVRDHKADLAAVNSKVVESMIKDGRVSENEIRLIWETPTYADYVWASRDDLGDKMEKKLTHVFLSLSQFEAGHIKILKDQRAGGFLPVSNIDFIDLASAMSGEK